MAPGFEDKMKPNSNEKLDESFSFLNKISFGSNLSFTHAFVSSLCVIVVSELGDKTFFIAAIMAMSHPRVTVFAGAMAALAIMHVMSGKS